MQNPKVLVVSHDAGGAELLSSWIFHNTDYQFDFHLEGPAKQIFSRKLNKVISNDFKGEIKDYQIVLTGTSWSSALEKEMIALAKEAHIEVISFLDHWGNYKERFILNNELIIPDWILVFDEHAYNLAKETFPLAKIKLERNYYIEDLQAYAEICDKNSQKKDEINLLYVCEPKSGHSQDLCGDSYFWGYTEYEAMQYFFDTLKTKVLNHGINKIRLRLHPSEEKHKYDYLLEKFPGYPIEISKQENIVDDCVWSDWIVGCGTMALVVGLYLNKKVFSAIPEGGKPHKLPFPEILNWSGI